MYAPVFKFSVQLHELIDKAQNHVGRTEHGVAHAFDVRRSLRVRLIVGSIGERIRIQSVYLHERSTFDAFSGSTGGDGSVKTRRRDKRHGFRFESRGDCILLRGADEFRDPSRWR